MTTEPQSFQERLLLPATSYKALDWQPIAITAMFSIFVHVFGSQDLRFESLPERLLAAALSVLPMYLIIGIAHKIPTRSQTLKIYLVLASYLIGGAIRGLTLSILLSTTGVLSDGGWQSRIPSSVISMSFTVAIVTYVWSTFKTHSDAITELVVETEQLKTALAQIEIETNSESLQYMSSISAEILAELERIKLSPGEQQIEEIQRVIDEQVRPLSKKFSLDLNSWVPANVKIPSAKFFKTWASLDPVSNMPSPWFAAAISLAPLPTAYALFGPATAITLSLFVFLALLPASILGLRLARKFIPQLRSPWREISFTAVMELIALPAVLATYLALIHTDNPSAYMVSGLITFPVYAWILAFGGALFEDLKNKRVALLEVQAQLNWAIARVNLLAWYNRGIISRLLHGPIQNAMHATLIKLRNRDNLTVVDNVIRELQQRIATAIETQDSAVRSITDLETALRDTTKLWREIAEVNIACDQEILKALLVDKPTAAIVIDLCSEICSNAIRHGKASEVHVEISSSASVIIVKVADNGLEQVNRNSSGLGTRFLESCSVNWSTTRENHQNHLRVLLPTSSF